MHKTDEKQITVLQLKTELDNPQADFIVLDVREPWELNLAALTDERVLHLPLSRIANLANPRLHEMNAEHSNIYVICHHGVRSLTVARWLRGQGWTNTYNVQGGIEQYRVSVDSTVGRY